VPLFQSAGKSIFSADHLTYLKVRRNEDEAQRSRWIFYEVVKVL